MKKLIVLLCALIMILSVTSVSADWLFNTIECDEFSVELPEGFEKGEATISDKVHSVSLHTGLVDVGELYRNIDVSTVPFENSSNDFVVNDEYTEGDLKVWNGEYFNEYGSTGNYTYAEFDKDGKHFYVEIDSPWASLDELNLTSDVKMVKDLKDSVKLK